MMKPNSILKRSFIAVLFILVFILTGCDTNPGNQPYEPDTPAPENHNGTFTSEHGSMVFNGDGKSITIDFDDELAGLINIPSGKHTGTYGFYSGELPPNGSVDVRYDVAHEMKLFIDDVTYTIDVGIKDEGGTYHTGLNVVTPDSIPFIFKVDDDHVNIIFKK